MSSYTKLERTGRYGHDFLDELSRPGKYCIPIRLPIEEHPDYDPEMDIEDKIELRDNYDGSYVDCDVLKVDNTGRYQVIIVKRADTSEIMALYYNGAENLFKNCTEYIEDGAYEFFVEDSESEIVDEMVDFWRKVNA